MAKHNANQFLFPETRRHVNRLPVLNRIRQRHRIKRPLLRRFTFPKVG
jgi:hypothetical protein